MKKLWRYLCVIAIANASLIAQPLEGTMGGGQEQSKSSKSGFFFSLGIGIIQNQVDLNGYSANDAFLKNYKSESLINGTFVAKVGGYHYFNPKTRMGLRYYYSLDFYAPYHNQAKGFSSNARVTSYYPFLTHLLNLDMTVLLYENQNNKFDFILGGGAGIRWGGGKLSSITQYQDFVSSNGDASTLSSADFEGVINIGLRWVKEKYGLELMTKVPITGPTIVQTSFNNSPYGATVIQPRFNITLNLSVEL